MGRVRRSFRYGGYLWLVDLDRLPLLPRPARPLASFAVRDHLGDPAAPSIRANVDAFLAEHGIDLRGGQVTMLASARVLGYVFNPLSVLWCHDAGGELAAVLAEVHNTFGGRHVYLLRPDARGRAAADKCFYVSPFLPARGRYLLRLPEPGQSLRIAVSLLTADGTELVASVSGRRQPATLRRLLGYSARYPWAPLRVALLIRWQGLRLLARGLPVTPRPGAAPGFLGRLGKESS